MSNFWFLEKREQASALQTLSRSATLSKIAKRLECVRLAGAFFSSCETLPQHLDCRNPSVGERRVNPGRYRRSFLDSHCIHLPPACRRDSYCFLAGPPFRVHAL